MFEPAASVMYLIECSCLSWSAECNDFRSSPVAQISHYATIKAPGPSDLLALAQLADS